MSVLAALLAATGGSWRNALVLSGTMAIGGTAQDVTREVLRRREWGHAVVWWGSFVVLVLAAVGLAFAIRAAWPLITLVQE